MKFLVILSSIAVLSGCGSFKQVLDSNDARKTEHMKFQVNRLSMVEKCYTNATTEALKHGCQLMQMQVQTEQGFTATAGLSALPETPEEQIKSGVLSAGKIAAGVKLSESLIEGLNRPNDVITVKDPLVIDRPVPVFVHTPPASSSEVQPGGL